LASYGVNPADRDPAEMVTVNVDVTRTLVEVAASWPAKAVVIVGSGAEYDLRTATAPIAEDHVLETVKSYGASKAAGGFAAVAVARASGLSLACARLFGVFGPGEAAHRLFPNLVRRLSAQQRVPLTSGDQARDVLYVDDVTSALIAIARLLMETP